MSMGILPMGAMSVISPDNYETKNRRPWVLDETLPKIKPPTDILTEAAKKRAVERAKNKPEEERTFIDYLILAQDKLDEISKKKPGVIYLSA